MGIRKAVVHQNDGVETQFCRHDEVNNVILLQFDVHEIIIYAMVVVLV